MEATCSYLASGEVLGRGEWWIREGKERKRRKRKGREGKKKEEAKGRGRGKKGGSEREGKGGGEKQRGGGGGGGRVQKEAAYVSSHKTGVDNSNLVS